MSQEIINKETYFALPLRDVVIFPGVITTILVGRERSINSIEEARKNGGRLFAIAQLNSISEKFDSEELYGVGTVCDIVEAVHTQEGNLKVVLRGISRAKLLNVHESERFFSVEVEMLSEAKIKPSKTLSSLTKLCIESFIKYAESNKKFTTDPVKLISKIHDLYDITYVIASHFPGSIKEKQFILSQDDVRKKIRKLLEIINAEIEMQAIENKISKSIQEKFTKHQKDVYLNEQLRGIKKELGNDEENEIEELKKKLKKLQLTTEVRKKCDIELSRLEKMSPYSSEAGVVRGYLEWILALPWNKESKLTNDLSKALKVLDEHHYGLEKVKERILEFLAVQMKTGNAKGPIICLVGAPGVGKTSLAKSIADSLNRQYVKVALGGVRDESEIRGHRRTYIGSMPGRIIQSMRKSETSNPLMLLDEIDKMSHDFRGDPSAALLEVLDPEQNHHFSDHYLEVEYDLSKVMFVATANSLGGIPIPLRDRMEIIRISGYTEKEKLNIAKRHLIPKQIKDNGLSNAEFSVDDEAILQLIRRYTFEAGVRNLNREIANLARKAAVEIVKNQQQSLHINALNLKNYAGVEKKHYGIVRQDDKIGITTGLAYTEYGGDLLNIEALKFDGSGKIQITGKLGDVMKESAQAALSYARSIAQNLKIDSKKFNKYDFHIHVPDGATPKDGPSAGVALCVSLVSALSDKAVKRDIAMTGEITLTGNVLEIGGLKEKLLAALRGGVKTVLIPEANSKDLEEMPKEVIDNLVIKPISRIEQALDEALVQ